MKFWLQLTSKGCVIMLRSSSVVTELVRLAILLHNRTGYISICKEAAAWLVYETHRYEGRNNEVQLAQLIM